MRPESFWLDCGSADADGIDSDGFAMFAPVISHAGSQGHALVEQGRQRKAAKHMSSKIRRKCRHRARTASQVLTCSEARPGHASNMARVNFRSASGGLKGGDSRMLMSPLSMPLQEGEEMSRDLLVSALMMMMEKTAIP